MQLKDFFSPEIVKTIANDIRAVDPTFNHAAFTRDAVRGLTDHELIARGKHICDALAKHLPQAFPAAARIIVASLGTALEDTAGNGMGPFKYLPHTLYVQHYGLDHFEEAMAAQKELTKRFTCEGSIRAFLIKYPKATYDRLDQWSADKDVHVRRLVSEGTRPRLPWHQRLPAFIKDPTPVLRLLDKLKDDSEDYVRRSVANNLNDIAKDHPDVVVATCKRWMTGASKHRLWVINHGLRTLIKRGHPGAMDLLGVGKPPRIKLDKITLSAKRIRIGETLRFDVELESQAAQSLLVDFRVHFVKANGETKPKVFKLKRVTLKKGEQATLSGRVSFKQHTTRTHYAGVHRLELMVNGKPYPLATVVLGH